MSGRRLHSRALALGSRLLAAALLLGLPGPAEASFILEVHDPIGPDLFSRYVYACALCTPAEHAAVTPPTGFVKQRPAEGMYSSASIVLPTPPIGVPGSLDLVPEIPGDDYTLVAQVLGGSIVEISPPGVFALVDVQRETVFTYDAGSVVHEVTDTDGNVYILFAFDLGLAGTIDPTVQGSLAGTPLPTGWTYSSRTLSQPLVVDSGGVAKVFSQTFSGYANTWQRYAAVPEPGGLGLLGMGLLALRGATRRRRTRRRSGADPADGRAAKVR